MFGLKAPVRDSFSLERAVPFSSPCKDGASPSRQTACILGNLFHGGGWLVRFICSSSSYQTTYTTAGSSPQLRDTEMDPDAEYTPWHGPLVLGGASTGAEVPQARAMPMAEECVAWFLNLKFDTREVNGIWGK